MLEFAPVKCEVIEISRGSLVNQRPADSGIGGAVVIGEAEPEELHRCGGDKAHDVAEGGVRDLYGAAVLEEID